MLLESLNIPLISALIRNVTFLHLLAAIVFHIILLWINNRNIETLQQKSTSR